MPPKDLDFGFTEFHDKYGMDQRYATVFYYAILLLMGNESAPINNV